MNLDWLTPKEISLRLPRGPTMFVAQCYGDFGCFHAEDVHGAADLIAHLPTGTVIPFTFGSLLDSANAVEELQKLRNFWEIGTDELVNRDDGLVTKMAEICKRFGGKPFMGGAVPNEAAPTMNGYGDN